MGQEVNVGLVIAPQWGVANGHHAEGPRKIHGAPCELPCRYTSYGQVHVFCRMYLSI